MTIRTLALLVTGIVFFAEGGVAHAQKDVLPVDPQLPAAPAATDGPSAPPADAQVPPGATTPPSPPPPPDYASRVRGHKPSPTWTQDRNFASTRVWLYDPGTYALETWSWTRIYDKDPTSYRFLQEFAWGIAPHLQLDLYGEFHIDSQNDVTTVGKQSYYPSWEGLRAELRIAIPNYYGQIPTNPVLYLEWSSFAHDPSRFEVRLLLGGAVNNWLFLAANPYAEFNVTASDKVFGKDGSGADIHQQVYLMDAEVGATLAAGFKVHDKFMLSAQAKIGGDMLGDINNRLHFVFWAGPGFILKPLPKAYSQYLKIIGVWLFLIPGSDLNGDNVQYGRPQTHEPTLIFSTQF